MFFIKVKIFLLCIMQLFSIKSSIIEEIKVVAYETNYIYDEKYAEGEEFLISPGIDGYFNGEELVAPVNALVKVGTRKNNDYEGIITGYGPDCYGCNQKGYVACKTADNHAWSLFSDGILYDDADYGSVAIVASDHKLFPCGTIIEINNANYHNLLAIVLDTGAKMRADYRNRQIVHLDLAFKSEKETRNVTNKNTTYHVKRWGF